MKITRRSNQGGSAATFIVVGVILILGLISTVHLLKQHGDQVRKEQAIAAYDKQQVDKEATRVKDAGKSGTVNTSDSGVPVSLSKTSGVSQELPTTGPRQTINKLFGMCLLTVAVTSYMLSRRRIDVRSL